MKNIFITGISYGLGLRLAEDLSRDHSNHVIGCSRTLSEELKNILDNRQNMEWHKLDLGQTDVLERNINDIIGERALHGVVNNAAILYKSLLVRADISSFLSMMDINIVAPTIVSKVAISNFLRYRVNGTLLFYSSICAHRGFSGLTMMGATKGAIESLSKNISVEYGRKGIRSNVISIGLLDTGMSNTVNDSQMAEIINTSSLRHATDTTSVVELSKYLLSDKSNSVTGQLFQINCGAL